MHVARMGNNEKCVQNFSLKTRLEETIWKTRALMREYS